MGFFAMARNMICNGFRKNSAIKPGESLGHYVLYAGAFREEFEVEGKCGFHFFRAGADCNSDRTDMFQQVTPVLVELLMPGLTQYIIEYPNYVPERDYYGLPAGCEIPTALTKTEQKHFAETKADIILLMDYDHDVWTILLSDNYVPDTLIERLEAFCELQKKELRQYLL